jgi:hypothetical protein
MQMKRSPKATANNEAFKEAVGLAWLDFRTPTFQRGIDDSLIVYHVASSSHMESAVEVVRLAFGSSHNLSYPSLPLEQWLESRLRQGYEGAPQYADEAFG